MRRESEERAVRVALARAVASRNRRPVGADLVAEHAGLAPDEAAVALRRLAEAREAFETPRGWLPAAAPRGPAPEVVHALSCVLWTPAYP